MANAGGRRAGGGFAICYLPFAISLLFLPLQVLLLLDPLRLDGLEDLLVAGVAGLLGEAGEGLDELLELDEVDAEGVEGGVALGEELGDEVDFEPAESVGHGGGDQWGISLTALRFQAGTRTTTGP